LSWDLKKFRSEGQNQAADWSIQAIANRGQSEFD